LTGVRFSFVGHKEAQKAQEDRQSFGASCAFWWLETIARQRANSMC
jgi:hypothetical protein